MVDVAVRKELAGDLRAFFAPSSQRALKVASSVAEKWRQKGYPKVAEHLEEHVEECLACLTFPESHQQRRLRTTTGPGEAKPGDKASHAGSEDLPGARGVPS